MPLPLSPHGFVTRRLMRSDVFWPELVYVDPDDPPEKRFERSPVFGMPGGEEGLQALCDDVVRAVVHHLEMVRYPLVGPDHHEIIGFTFTSVVVPALDNNRYRVEMGVSDPDLVTDELLARLREEVFLEPKWRRYCLAMTSYSRFGSIYVDRRGALFGRSGEFHELANRMDQWRQESYDECEKQSGDEVRILRAIKESLRALPHLVHARQAQVVAVTEDKHRRPTAWVYVPLDGDVDRRYAPTSEKISTSLRLVDVGPNGTLGIRYLNDPRSVGRIEPYFCREGFSNLTRFEIKAQDSDHRFTVELDPASLVTLEGLRERYGRVWPARKWESGGRGQESGS